MMGRYLLYHMHPFSLAEAAEQSPLRGDVNKPIQLDHNLMDRLLTYGGFPKPFFLKDSDFLRQWHAMRHQQLFGGDLNTLSNVQELANIEKLALLLREQTSKNTSFANLAAKVGVSSTTIKRWIIALNGLYYTYEIKPWSKNITRSLIKEPKYSLWDWSLIHDRGARIENFIGSHLIKSVQLWNDTGKGEYGLYYLRDRQKREVDFLVTKNREPWFLVEVKSSEKNSLSPELAYFQKQTKAPHAFQVAYDLPYENIDCFTLQEPSIVPAITFLSQLV